MYKFISGFSDEIDANLDKQLQSLNKLNLAYLSIRGIDDKNIADFDLISFNDYIKPKLDKYKISISSLGSPIGKIEVDDESSFYNQKKILENLCQICNENGIKYIRIFSFYIPKGKNHDSYKDIVISKLRQFIDIANKYNVMLIHENEKGIYGDTPDRCKILAENLFSKNFGLIFDFANYVQVGVNTIDAYKKLKEYLVYIHIKDAKYDNLQNVVAGTGDGNIEKILKDLFENGYNGFLTLEPHLVKFDSLQSLEKENADNIIKEDLVESGFEGYEMQLIALNNILKKIY